MVEPTQFPIALGTNVEPGPDGKNWITMTVAANFINFTFMMPVAACQELVVQLPEMLKGAIKQAKGLNGDSLIVTSQLPKEARHGK